ncbi:MAG TPA: putative metal-binding motif-containing protein, partial [Myxococcota bacterium]|nr:putative metal-binding motif-containing protein [Myxococcota bacterium]
MILFLALALASPLDVDQDGFDASVDCDDADPAVHPEAIETCDAEDHDCDGAVDEASLQLTPAVDPTCAWHGADRDLDGYGDAADAYCLCAGYEALAIDPSTGAVVDVEPPEVCLGADGAPGHLIGGVCYVLDQSDCDDVDGAARPGGPEALDGLDDDCDGALPIVELDCDADGAPALPHLLPAPGAPIDAASLGLVDCGDADCGGRACDGAGRLCVGGGCACPGGSVETQCDDGVNNDCDAGTDCDDLDCELRTCGAGRICDRRACMCASSFELSCSNHADDDCDGAVDCADSDCAGQVCGDAGRTCSGSACVCSGGGSETRCDDAVDG